MSRYRNNQEIKDILENYCNVCDHKSEDKACGCEILNRPCDLKYLLRAGSCPLKLWTFDIEKEENNKENGV